MDVRGKVAVVTGSASGIGRETALKLASLGCGVLINYSRSEDEAQETLAQVKAQGVPAIIERCDISDDAGVRRMMQRAVDELGGIDILVNNAGTTAYVPHGDLEGLTEEIWDRILGVNLKGTFFCIRAALPSMKARGGGSIVNVSALAAVKGGGSSLAYAASKAGINNLTFQLSRVLGADNIRINAVAPGFIDGRWQRSRGLDYERLVAGALTTQSLKIVNTPEKVAEIIVSLITGFDLVTGQTIVIDGGEVG